MDSETTLLELDGDPRDFLLYRRGSGYSIEVFDIQVGSARGKGKGRRLIERLLGIAAGDGAHLVWAITRESNLIAQDFYKAIGWRRIGRLKGFYRDTLEDGLMFGVNLP